jgi:hypothetical protein
MDFTGDFETHLTVRLPADVPAESSVAALRATPDASGLKCTHIVLARGRTPSQPMLTLAGQGTLSHALAAADALRDRLADAGFDVCRVKIEAAPWNQDVPATDADGAAHPPQRYFEHHVKLLLPPGDEPAGLSALAQAHGAHLSRNALRRRDDGRRERFVTQRCHAVGRETASRRLASLLDALRAAGHEVIDVEEEFVVYDSDLALDDGWIETVEPERQP